MQPEQVKEETIKLRNEIKKINKDIAVNVHTIPSIYIEVLLPKINITSCNAEEINTYIKQLEEVYKIISEWRYNGTNIILKQ